MNIDVEQIREWIEDIIRKEGLNSDEFEIVEVRAYGSRTTGRASKDSDLDILVEYRGNLREDDAFNILHDEEYVLDGVIVDINPIKADKSGTTEEYLRQCDDDWKMPRRKR